MRWADEVEPLRPKPGDNQPVGGSTIRGPLWTTVVKDPVLKEDPAFVWQAQRLKV